MQFEQLEPRQLLAAHVIDVIPGLIGSEPTLLAVHDGTAYYKGRTATDPVAIIATDGLDTLIVPVRAGNMRVAPDGIAVDGAFLAWGESEFREMPGYRVDAPWGTSYRLRDLESTQFCWVDGFCSDPMPRSPGTTHGAVGFHEWFSLSVSGAAELHIGDSVEYVDYGRRFEGDELQRAGGLWFVRSPPTITAFNGEFLLSDVRGNAEVATWLDRDGSLWVATDGQLVEHPGIFDNSAGYRYAELMAEPARDGFIVDVYPNRWWISGTEATKLIPPASHFLPYEWPPISISTEYASDEWPVFEFHAQAAHGVPFMFDESGQLAAVDPGPLISLDDNPSLYLDDAGRPFMFAVTTDPELGREPWVYRYDPGDVDGSRRFDSTDLVWMFTRGKYETGLVASWYDGDFTGDGLFDSSDIVAAMAAGFYTRGITL